MNGFSTSGWMSANELLAMIQDTLKPSVDSWLKYQQSVKDADEAVRSKHVSKDMRITASDDGQQFRLHKRLGVKLP